MRVCVCVWHVYESYYTHTHTHTPHIHVSCHTDVTDVTREERSLTRSCHTDDMTRRRQGHDSTTEGTLCVAFDLLYGVAMISRLLQIIGLSCKRAL